MQYLTYWECVSTDHVHSFVNDINHWQWTERHIREGDLDLLLNVPILSGGEGWVVKQHLQSLHWVVITQFIKHCCLSTLRQWDVLKARGIQYMDLVLLGNGRTCGRSLKCSKRRRTEEYNSVRRDMLCAWTLVTYTYIHAHSTGYTVKYVHTYILIDLHT